MRIALLIEYDGTNYYGFQKQKIHQSKTIQYHIDQSIKIIANHTIKSSCGGRTDTGVHAFNQVVHFDTKSKRKDFNWVKGINTYLPNDIFVKKIFHVNDDFHARFSALSRTYRYVIYNSKIYSPLYSKYTLHCEDELDIDAIKKSFVHLIGEKNFSSFRSSGCVSVSPKKLIKSIQIKKHNNLIFIDVTANSFLYHMVRNMVGFFIDIGKGKIDLKDVKDLIESRDRKKLSKTVPPFGLYLTKITYPSKYDIFQNERFNFLS